MITRNSRNSGEKKTFYTLFDWGDNKQLLPTESITDCEIDETADTENADRLAEQVGGADCEDFDIPAEEEIKFNKLPEGGTQYKFPPFEPKAEDSGRPISPIEKVTDTADDFKDDTQELSTFFENYPWKFSEDIEQYLQSCSSSSSSSSRTLI